VKRVESRSISLAFIFMLGLFIVPMAFTLSNAFIVDSRFSLSALAKVAANPYNLRILGFSLLQAFLSSLLSLSLGIIGSYVLAAYSFRLKSLVRVVYSVPFVLPSILVVLGFVIFWGNSGFLNSLLERLLGTDEPVIKVLYSFPAILMAHAFYNYPVAVNIISSTWEAMDNRVEMAASSLGAGRVKAFLTVTLPRLKASIISAGSLIFLYCFTSFAIILVLGGGPRFTTMEVEIYRKAKLSMDISSASVLCLFSLVICLLVLWIYNRAQRKAKMIESFEISSQKLPKIKKSLHKRGLEAFLVYSFIILSLIYILGPLASIFLRAFLSSSSRSASRILSLKAYEKIFSAGSASLLAIANSSLIALASAIMSTLLALELCAFITKARTAALELVSMLPMAVSSVMLGLGYWMLSRYMGFLDKRVLIALSHTILSLPFALRTLLPAYRSLPANLRNAALTLGADSRKAFWQVHFPLLWPSVLASLLFGFAISLGELNATLMLGDGRLVTVPVLLYRLIGSYDYQSACALGSILIIVSLMAFGLGELLKRRRHA
jgi:thiamine transport system permease protein